MNCFGRSLLTTVRVVIVDDGRTLVITQLDHCNSVLVATFVYLQDRLQSVLNAAARLVYSRRTSEHTTPLLRELYWLRVPERIQFRLCILAYHCVHSTGIPVWQPAADIRDRRSSLSPLCWHHDTTSAFDSSSYPVPFRWLQRGHRTVCHQRLGPHLWHSEGRSSLAFFVSHTADLALSIQTIGRRLRWAVQQF